MWNKDLELIYKDFLSKYYSEGVKCDPDKLRKYMVKEAKKANIRYTKLSEPKTCSLKLYIKNWVRESVFKDFTQNTLRTINLDNPGGYAYAKALADFFNLYSLERIQEYNKKIYEAKPGERLDIWKGLDLPVEKIDEKIKGVIVARNQDAIDKGFSSHIEFALDTYKIPYVKYERIINNTDEIIDYCYKKLPEISVLPSWFYSEFGPTCYKCQIKSFPFKDYSEVINFIEGEYPILRKFRKKIFYKTGEKDYMTYKKEKDRFEIYVRGDDNFRHKSLTLIHELGHVVSNLNCFKKGFNPLEKGKYFSEKDIIPIEFNLLRKASPQLYQAYFGDILGNFYVTLFEIELYKNPNQDLGRLNARAYNRCFKGARQKTNRSYLLDKELIMSPLSNLRYSVAHSEIILA